MDDPTRGVLGSQPPEEPQNMEPAEAPTPARSSDEGATLPIAPSAGPVNRDPKFIGDAMRLLYRSSATSIERGDATRVIGRTETESIRPGASVPPKPQQTVSSVPPGPRVDVTLWVVLALGLFAIAGVMLSAAL